MPNPSIWLFRDQQSDDPFVRIISLSGFSVRCLPVLATEYVDTPIDLEEDVDAVVVTSQRSVEALTRRQNFLDKLNDKHPGVPWFVTGPATARKLAKLGVPVRTDRTCSADDAPGGKEPSSGAPDGSLAASLAKTIIDSGARHVLYLAGDPHRPELPELLSEGGIDVQIRTLYRTIPVVPSDWNVPNVQNAPVLLNALSARPGPDTIELPDWVCFFSPRGVATVFESQDIDWSGVKIAAIGPTTAEALRVQGIVPDAVAPRPEPESLVEAILGSDSQDTAVTVLGANSHNNNAGHESSLHTNEKEIHFS